MALVHANRLVGLQPDEAIGKGIGLGLIPRSTQRSSARFACCSAVVMQPVASAQSVSARMDRAKERVIIETGLVAIGG